VQISISYLLLFVLLGVGSSCKKDEPAVNLPGANGDNGGGVFNPWSDGSTIRLVISGLVDDEQGNPVCGALVKAGTLSCLTDSNGIFFMKDAPARTGFGYVKVEKSGYFPGSRSFLPLEGGVNVRIRLLSKDPAGTIDSRLGGSVSIASGAELSLDSGSVTRNGERYNGIVSVFLKHIDPTTEGFENRMPGNLLATDGNSSAGLKSFGMLAAELQDESGQLLQIAPGRKARLKIPLPASLLSEAGDSIDMWYFDEQNGYWVKEGRAGKENGFYHARVGHFSFWNADVPYKFISMKGRVLIRGKSPGNARITISSPTMGTAGDYCNSEGRFGGNIPKNEILALKIATSCGNNFTEVYSANIGPFAADVNLNDISVDLINATQVNVRITGCYGAPVGNAYVVANGRAFFTDEAGKFSHVFCGDKLQIHTYGTNPWVKGSGDTVMLSGGTMNVYLQACKNPESGGTVKDVDGNEYNTVVIGTQEWFQENLKVSRYRDSTPIPQGLTDTVWKNSYSGLYSYYQNNSSNQHIYGKLYNWYAVTDNRGLCPEGWHVPSLQEWKILENFLGGEDLAGGKMKSVRFAGSSLWYSPNMGATNESGFSGLPGGMRVFDNSEQFSLMGESGIWWSSSTIDFYLAWVMKLSYMEEKSDTDAGAKRYGYSVRCIRD